MSFDTDMKSIKMKDTLLCHIMLTHDTPNRLFAPVSTTYNAVSSEKDPPATPEHAL